MKELLIKEVAERFRVDASTVRRWVYQGRIKGHRYGRDWRFPASEIDRFEAEARGEVLATLDGENAPQSPAWYAELAKVYTEAASAGQPPAKAVERHFGLAASTASKRISEARAAGLLPPFQRGGSQWNPKVSAVAKALGVSYDELVRVVREYAGGDLRVVSGETVSDA